MTGMQVCDRTCAKLSLCAFVTVLAGCAGVHGTTPMPAEPLNASSARSLTSSGFQSLYSFTGTPNGSFPLGGLVALDGTLYGTTSQGGSAKGSTCGRFGCGIVFKVSKSGSEHVLYRFQGGSDGATPEGVLTVLGGALYGTTTFGGSSCGCGTVFKVSTSGARASDLPF